MTRQLSKFMTAVPRIGECVIYLLIFTIGVQMNAVLCLIITFPTVSTIFKSSPHEDLCTSGGGILFGASPASVLPAARPVPQLSADSKADNQPVGRQLGYSSLSGCGCGCS